MSSEAVYAEAFSISVLSEKAVSAVSVSEEADVSGDGSASGVSGMLESVSSAVSCDSAVSVSTAFSEFEETDCSSTCEDDDTADASIAEA